MKQILIRPVQLAVSEENTVLTSLALGSSLAVCMYDVNRHIGGMVHTLLPRVPEKEAAGQELRYVDTSIVALFDAMMAKGADAYDLRAKLAGGARIFSFAAREKYREIGRENVDCARQKLQELNIPVISEDTGENYGRSIYFYTDDGKLEIETVNHAKYLI